MDTHSVLLVDDEEDFVLALGKRLKARGLRVDEAYRGEEAVEKVRKGRYDVIILDLAMPGMDGLETLKAIKAIDEDVQVILLTGHATVRKGVDAMKLGAADFVQKPAEFQELLVKVEAAGAEQAVLVAQRTESHVEDILRSKGW